MPQPTASIPLTDRYAAARRTLQAAGQGHALDFYDRLDDPARARLLDQIDSVDWPEVAHLVATHARVQPVFTLPPNLKPAPWYPHVPAAAQQEHYRRARACGEDLIRRNRVAAFTVAGGQGTRLGWDGPKGTFPATPIRRLPLFGCLAEYLRKVQQKYQTAVPWYVMTSPINDAATRAFFAAQGYFGLDPAHVMIFPQAMMPALDALTGRVLLEGPGSLALSPNGHGGSLKALWSGGALADMRRRGIEQICYTQVDNPIVRVVDPLFLGLHALDGCEMSSKMLPKREPLEKLGNFCLVDGKMTVIEYSDLPDELAHERLPGGGLRFLAGSIAIHMLTVAFVDSLHRGGSFRLPYHRALKKVPYFDPRTGAVVKPQAPNAVKLETFVFDALSRCAKSIVYETDRADEFAPIKNAPGPGVLDSPETSQRIQIERAARWLESAGTAVARSADGSCAAAIEVSQLTAIEPDDLRAAKLPARIEPGASVVL